jgi:hypothetical protein
MRSRMRSRISQTNHCSRHSFLPVLDGVSAFARARPGAINIASDLAHPRIQAERILDIGRQTLGSRASSLYKRALQQHKSIL